MKCSFIFYKLRGVMTRPCFLHSIVGSLCPVHQKQIQLGRWVLSLHYHVLPLPLKPERSHDVTIKDRICLGVLVGRDRNLL